MLLIPLQISPRLAQAFVDYMATTKNISLHLIEQQNQLMLSFDDAQHLTMIEQELETFLKNPLDKRYQAASWQLNKQKPNPFVYLSSSSYWRNLRAHAGPMTFSIAFICIAIFIIMRLVGIASVMNYLAYPANYQQDWQIWRWVSHIFLHFSLLHILFNLLWWWYLAGQIEHYQGKGKLLTITLVSALLTGWVQFHISGIYFGGLSGVVYALIGYTWLFSKLHPESPLSLPTGLMVFALLWLVAGYADLFNLSIANAAHTTGLVIGLLMALQDRFRPNPSAK